MKPFQIALIVAVAGAVMFFYQVHQITGLNEEAAAWRSQVDQYNNPGASPFIRAFFDGLTLGAFSDEGIFTESKKIERAGQQLEATRVSIVSRYASAVSSRNWGFVVAAGALITSWVLKKKTPSATGVRLGAQEGGTQ
jgi:hypothetical protein